MHPPPRHREDSRTGIILPGALCATRPTPAPDPAGWDTHADGQPLCAIASRRREQTLTRRASTQADQSPNAHPEQAIHHEESGPTRRQTRQLAYALQTLLDDTAPEHPAAARERALTPTCGALPC